MVGYESALMNTDKAEVDGMFLTKQSIADCSVLAKQLGVTPTDLLARLRH